MKISNGLPHFNNEKALIITTGEYTAFFYLAHEGNIILADSFIIEKPDFTDIKEGRFGNTSTGSPTIGGVYELQKQYLQNRFLNTLDERINLLQEKENLDSIYLFSPQYVLKGIEEVLNKNDRYSNKLRVISFGNFIHHHPFELLGKIKEYKLSQVPEPVDINEIKKVNRR